MAIEHTQYPLAGIQFHPEATLTQFGFRLLANFLEISGIELNIESTSLSVDQMADTEFCFRDPEANSLPAVPVTF